MIGCYLGAKIQSQAIANQNVTHSFAGVRHQHGISRFQFLTSFAREKNWVREGIQLFTTFIQPRSGNSPDLSVSNSSSLSEPS